LIVKKHDDYQKYQQENSSIRIKPLDEDLKKLDQQYSISEDSESDKLSYVFRQLLIHFISGGPIGIYKGQDITTWYLKIFFKERIESDISSLDENLTIYRGTSEEEYESKKFGQSWSLNKEVAFAFAFSHYSNSPEHVGTMRVILEAEIDRKNVLYYDKNEPKYYQEDEVVVDAEKLRSIKVIKKDCL